MKNIKTLSGIVNEIDDILIEYGILVNLDTIGKIQEKVCDAYVMGKEDTNKNKRSE